MTVRKLPYLYITGAGYSGSTLLALLLNAHPEIASVGEGAALTRNPRDHRCSCGDCISECPFFRAIEKRINELGTRFSLQQWNMRFEVSRRRLLNIPLVRPLRSTPLEEVRDRLVRFVPGYRKAIETLATMNLHFAQAVIGVTGKTVFADAEKDSIRIKFLRDIHELDLRAVHLVRDVRAGTASIMRNKRIADSTRATRLWLRANTNSERAKRYLSPDRWLTVTYSDLCLNTQKVMDRLADFVGARRFPVPSSIYEAEHHILGNKMRLKRDDGAVLADNSWEGALSEQQLRVIARVAGEANRRFGFDWP
jgi:hypothetical protein